MEYFCEMIWNSDKWFICRYKILLIYSSSGPFVQQSGTTYAILVESIMGKTQ